jgi:hypothetical protein
MPPVSRIRLRVEERKADIPCRYRAIADPVASTQFFPMLRLTALAQLVSQTGGPNSLPTRALIDTGAWISALETGTWLEYDRAGLIEHLSQNDVPLPSPALIGGHRSTYRLGRVWVRLVDLMPARVNWLPAISVVAQVLENELCRLPAPFLLGLHGGVLEGRKLTREPIPTMPGPIPPNHNSDCGAWYGQQWYLETA